MGGEELSAFLRNMVVSGRCGVDYVRCLLGVVKTEEEVCGDAGWWRPEL